MFCLLTVWFIWEGPDSVSKFLAAEIVGGFRLASRVPDFILSAHFVSLPGLAAKHSRSAAAPGSSGGAAS